MIEIRIAVIGRTKSEINKSKSISGSLCSQKSKSRLQFTCQRGKNKSLIRLHLLRLDLALG